MIRFVYSINRGHSLRVPISRPGHIPTLEVKESTSSGNKCDSKNQDVQVEEKTVLPETERQKVIGNCPEVDVMFGNIKVKSLLDCGSQVTTITENCYNKQFRNNPMFDSTWLRLAGSNGLPIPTVGIFKTTVTIQGNEFMDTYVIVVQDPSDPFVRQRKVDVPGVIGCNIFKKLCSMNRTNISTELSRTLKKYEEQLVLSENISAKVINEDTQSIGKVKTPHGRLTIPANSEVTISGTTRQDIENCTVLVEPPLFSTPHGLIVYPTLDKVKNGMVSCNVMNMSDIDVILTKPTPIANIVLYKYAGLELTNFRATREHSTSSPIGISHLASQVGTSHHYARSHIDKEALYQNRKV